ncbi:MAG TPA: MMPL family transporter [Solirubrobacterales bacterium]|nr:MMPL family transporter [Solirubrobacterales bacterium]
MARFLTRRARLVVGIWVVLLVLLGLEGKNLDHEVSSRPVAIAGTATKRASELAAREFGNDSAMIVVLQGPPSAVEQQGRLLERHLDALPRSLVVSPWVSGAALEGLRPSPNVAALIVRLERPADELPADLLRPIQQQVDRTVKAPVRVSLTGLPTILESYRRASEQAAKVGELVAVPVLLIVLLLVFRSVFAAAIPVLMGGAVVAVGRGVLSLLTGVTEFDAFSPGVLGMMGLALGVDYSLLVVSRFREEIECGGVSEAVQATVKATGRSIIPAGCGLMLAMAVASRLVPGAMADSVSIAVIVVTLLSMVSAMCVVPAVLYLVGNNLDRWSWRRRRDRPGAALRWSSQLSSRPRVVVGIMAVLLFLAGWAFTLDTDLATSELLPSGDPGRIQQEQVEHALGPGWTAPIEVIMNGRGRPVTSPHRLQALVDFQHQVERDPGVKTMAGFGEVASKSKRLGGIERGLGDQEHALVRLDTGLSRVHEGATLNTSGLLKAAVGARKLDAGIGTTHSGAGLLSNGLQSVTSGSARLSNGLSRASDGSGQLAQGTSKASSGAGKLADALAKVEEQTRDTSGSARLIKRAMHAGNERLSELHSPLQTAEGKLDAAGKGLQQMTTGQADPQYATVLAAIEEATEALTGIDPKTGEPASSMEGVGAGVKRAEGQFALGGYLATKVGKNERKGQEATKKLADASERLDHGLRRLVGASNKISVGISQLSRGGERLSPGLSRLSDGADRLAKGLGLLETGAGGLASGLGGGAQKSRLLSGAVHRIDSGVKRQREDSSGSDLRKQSPGLFKSGFFFLAGLDGSQPERRNQLGFLINLNRGGMDARMMVIPRFDPSSPEVAPTRARLQEDADELARKTGSEVLIGGLPLNKLDINSALRDQAPGTRLALSLVTLLILIPVLRSLLLPLIAAVINFITVGASFGLLSLLFNNSLLGGPGYVDTAVLPATMIVMFGLAIDYEVFVFARMREEYVRTGSPSEAVTNGLRHTAQVVTGAACIMMAVFLAFSLSSFISIRDFGIAQSIGIFIDAFIIRIVVVPALMRALGKWSWWLPRWLDRLLPGKSVAPEV